MKTLAVVNLRHGARPKDRPFYVEVTADLLNCAVDGAHRTSINVNEYPYPASQKRLVELEDVVFVQLYTVQQAWELYGYEFEGKSVKMQCAGCGANIVLKEFLPTSGRYLHVCPNEYVMEYGHLKHATPSQLWVRPDDLKDEA